MTWLKLSDDFSDECARVGLSDAAFRTHVEGLLWTMRRETDGVLDRLDVRRLAETRDADAAIAELVAAGFWTAHGDHWRIHHHMQHQPESDVISKRRENTADRVRRHRRKHAGLPKESNGNAVTHPVTERVTRDGTGRVGSGNYAPIGEVLDGENNVYGADLTAQLNGQWSP